MKCSVEVGLCPGHIVLYGPSPPRLKMGAQPPIFGLCLCQTAGGMKMPLGTEIVLGPGDIVLDGDPAPLPKKGGTAACPNFWLMSIVAKWLDGLG